MLVGKGEWPSSRILRMGLFKEISGYKHYSKRFKILCLCECSIGISYSGGIVPLLLNLDPG
jgi:hypothetical protein